jgi:dolichyl-phosphate beta-glucosyltransferase
MIVVPCYNEELRLPVEQFERFLGASDVRFVFVDDGSRDKTLDRLERPRTGHPERVFMLRFAGQSRQGRGRPHGSQLCPRHPPARLRPST